MMQLRPIPVEDLHRLYHDCLVRDFPPEERKSYQSMERLVRLGEYDMWGLYDGGEFLAYALFWLCEGREYVMLDYLAVEPAHRNKGLGGQMLTLLAERYEACKGVLVEAEAPRPEETPEENEHRRRRLNFYRRAGFQDMGYTAFLFGVWYTLFFSKQAGEKTAEILIKHENLYKRGAALAGKQYTPILYEES